MGDYMITIEGTGSHHNNGNNQQDADVMARDFVEQLKNAGHSIRHAGFRSGRHHHDLNVGREEHRRNIQDAMAQRLPVVPSGVGPVPYAAGTANQPAFTSGAGGGDPKPAANTGWGGSPPAPRVADGPSVQPGLNPTESTPAATAETGETATTAASIEPAKSPGEIRERGEGSDHPAAGDSSP